VKPGKGSFIGRDAVATQLSNAPAKKLRLLAIDSRDPDPVGGEPILLAGEPVGRLTSAAYGYTAGHALGLAYLGADLGPT
ncbi:glycine cleavage T C-terminal barrel domain-containing protein, partial [Pseudomonas sp. FW305-25]|uniref:glycine cleavage T C-terminal barrel domain-containing protein n=1 Tax=Pseudomonas sp. FW305-25 TaxID=2070636 RepID=UPI000CBF153E